MAAKCWVSVKYFAVILVFVLCACIFISNRYKDLYTYTFTEPPPKVQMHFTNKPASVKNKEHNGSMKFTLLTSYMRSGSTFLGSLLGLQSNIFYYYEPLHKGNIYNYVQGDQYCSYTKPICETRPEKKEEFLNYLTDLYNCIMVPHADKFNFALLNVLGGPKWKQFNECRAKEENTVLTCLKEMENECRKYKFRSAKVLRMSLYDAAELLDRLPNLQLIHLFRDPRAIINSHLRTKWYPLKIDDLAAIQDDITASCRRIAVDVDAAYRLRVDYPGRIKIVQYDDLYGNASKLAKVFEFTGMPVTQELNTYIKNKIGTRTTRAKGFHPAASYRKTLPPSIEIMIEKSCVRSIQKLGLTLFYHSKEDLTNVSISHMEDTLPFEVN